jgi:hypothetical protein
MGDLRNKARKEERADVVAQQQRRRDDGWTVFHFDLNPKFTRRNLFVGEAIRELMRRTHTRIAFWRCPVRGLAVQYQVLPTSSYIWDRGASYRIMDFSTLADEMAAKKQLVENMLLKGIDYHRALPNKVFDSQMALMRSLLEAPPSLGAEDWNAGKAQLHEKFQPLLHTHLATLWLHVLGKRFATDHGDADWKPRPTRGSHV